MITFQTNRGFTIIEFVAAMAVFAVLAIMGYGSLKTVVDSRQAVESTSDNIRSLQRAFHLIAQDFEQFHARPVRNAFGDPQPAVSGQDSGSVELTRGGWPTPFDLPQSGLVRVRYDLEDDILVRSSWVVLDRAQDSQPIKSPILQNVEAIKFRYLNDQSEWKDTWPENSPQSNSGIGTQQTAKPAGHLIEIPRVVELSLSVKDVGEITYLLRMDNLPRS